MFDLLKLDHYPPTRTRHVLSRARSIGDILPGRNGRKATTALREMLGRVFVAEEEVRIVVSAIGLSGLSSGLGLDPGDAMGDMVPDDPARYSIGVPGQIKRCGGAGRLVVSDEDIENGRKPDPALVKLLSRAHDWYGRLVAGKKGSAAEIARDEGLTRSYVTRVIRLAFLAPGITEAILDGRQPADLNAERLVRHSRLPLDWDDQRRVLGFN